MSNPEELGNKENIQKETPEQEAMSNQLKAMAESMEDKPKTDSEILGVNPDATLTEIRKRFNEVTSSYAGNPDASKPENQKKFLQTEYAYRRLRDAAKAKEGQK